MVELVTPFRIDILTATGIKQGEITTCTSLNDTRRLSKIGSCTFTMPASDELTQYINEGSMFDIWDEYDQYLGRFVYKSRTLRDSRGQGQLTIEASDLMKELTRQQVGFSRKYEAIAVDEIIDDLISLSTGWTTSIESGIGYATVTYEGQSIFSAIDELRNRWGKNFRLSGTRTLEFGDFGSDSGLTLFNMAGVVQTEFSASSHIAIAESLKIDSEGDEIVNRIIPLGGGQGIAQTTLAQATPGSYAIQTGSNQDGTNFYYIEDAQSIAQYGLREKVVIITQIRPADNTASAITNAANELRVYAENYLNKNKSPRIEYAVSVVGLTRDVKVGDKIRLKYAGDVDGYTYIDVDEEFYVMDITRSRSANGQRSANINIASVNQRRVSDKDLMVSMVNDVTSLKVSVQPTAFLYEKTLLDTVDSGDIYGNYYPRKDAIFPIHIDAAVLKVQRCVVRFRTRPINSFTFTYEDAVTAADVVYAIIKDDQYPTNLHMLINGRDISTEAGGVWNPLSQNTALDEEVDITEYLLDAESLQGRHEIRFYCDQQNAAYPTNTSLPPEWVTDQRTDRTTRGWIECSVIVQGVTQGIITE